MQWFDFYEASLMNGTILSNIYSENISVMTLNTFRVWIMCDNARME